MKRRSNVFSDMSRDDLCDMCTYLLEQLNSHRDVPLSFKDINDLTQSFRANGDRIEQHHQSVEQKINVSNEAGKQSKKKRKGKDTFDMNK